MIGFEFEGVFLCQQLKLKTSRSHIMAMSNLNWKTGLIGRNGIGKSALFRLLLNQEVYQGKISKSVT